MLETKKDFNTILNEAKSYGYAESDPTYDINGMDTAHKLSIISSLAFNNLIDIKKVYVSGIEKIKYKDLKFANELGYKIKLIGITKIVKTKIIQFVYPALLKSSSLLGNVDNVFNGILIETDSSKKLFFQGEGAGALPTATSVLADLERICKPNFNCSNNEKLKKIFKNNHYDILERNGSYYLRIKTFDETGVIADISKLLKKYDISIKSLYQKDHENKNNKEVDIIITTHNCAELNINKVVKLINNLESTKEKVVSYRIETI